MLVSGYEYHYTHPSRKCSSVYCSTSLVLRLAVPRGPGKQGQVVRHQITNQLYFTTEGLALFLGSDPLPHSQAQTHCLVPRLRPTANFSSLLLVCKVWQGKTREIFSVSYVIVFCPPNFLRTSGTFSVLPIMQTHHKASSS